MKLWNWGRGERALVRSLAHPEGVTSIAFSPDGKLLASGSYDKAVRIFRVEDGALLQTLTGHALTIWSLGFSADGRWLASSGEDQSVKVWRLEEPALK